VTETIISGNGNIIFPPLSDRPIRSRFVVKRFGKNYRLDSAIYNNEITMIPGEVICLDLDRNRGRVVDSLGFASSAELLERLKQTGLEMKLPYLVPPIMEPLVVPLDAYGVATWAFWMHRLIQQGCSEASCEKLVRPVQHVERLPPFKSLIESRMVKFWLPGDASAALHRERERHENLYSSHTSWRNTLSPYFFSNDELARNGATAHR
jgi:hypothetical protein